MLRLLLVAAAVAAAAGLVLGLGFIKAGVYDVAAAKRHTKFTEWLTHETMTHSVRRRAGGIAPPARTTAAQLVAGFCAYETHCVACHGAAAVARQQWVSGMEPQPPYLLDSTARFSPPELFWIARNGIKMTGMPAWGLSMSDREIWNVVAWLEASRRLPPQTYRRWRSAGRCFPSLAREGAGGGLRTSGFDARSAAPSAASSRVSRTPPLRPSPRGEGRFTSEPVPAPPAIPRP